MAQWINLEYDQLHAHNCRQHGFAFASCWAKLISADWFSTAVKAAVTVRLIMAMSSVYSSSWIPLLNMVSLYQPFAENSTGPSWRGHKIRNRLVWSLARYRKAWRNIFLSCQRCWHYLTSCCIILLVLKEYWAQRRTA